jgi:hypothetical protein
LDETNSNTITEKEKTEMSFRAEVITNNEGDWVSNRLRFFTAAEANDYGYDLAARWTMVTAVRVVETDDPANYRYLDGELLVVVELV